MRLTPVNENYLLYGFESRFGVPKGTEVIKISNYLRPSFIGTWTRDHRSKIGMVSLS